MKQLFFLAAGVAVNVANYGYHLLTARGLTAGEYGALSGLFGVIMGLAVLAIALQTATARCVARGRSAGEYAAVAWLGGGLIGLLGLVAARPLFVALSAPTGAEWAFVLGVGVMLAESVHRGRLQGAERWALLSAGMLADAGGKLLGWWLFASYGFAGAVWAFALGAVLSLPFGAVWPRLTHIKEKLGPLAGISAAQLGLLGFVSYDLTYAAATHAPLAGGYSAVSRVASLLYLGGGMGITLWYTGRVAGTPHRHWAWLTGLGFALAGGAFVAFPAEIISLLFSPKYAEAAAFMPPLVGVMGLLLLASFQLHARWADRDHRADTVLTAGVLMWGVSTTVLGLELRQMLHLSIVVLALSNATIAALSARSKPS